MYTLSYCLHQQEAAMFDCKDEPRASGQKEIDIHLIRFSVFYKSFKS